MAYSHQRCAIADYTHLSPEIVNICTGVHLLVQVENTTRKHNCDMKIAELENTSALYYWKTDP